MFSIITYLKPWWVKIVRRRVKFWIMMDVPEQWHDFPTLRYKISFNSCTKHFRNHVGNSKMIWKLKFLWIYTGSKKRILYSVSNYFLPLYTTSTTASLKVNDMILDILRLSKITCNIYKIVMRNIYSPSYFHIKLRHENCVAASISHLQQYIVYTIPYE